MSEDLEPRKRDITRAYLLLRVTLGLNICLHGVVRWTKGLAKTPLPHRVHLTSDTFSRSPKLLVGAAVLFGLQTRCALQTGFILMLARMFGS